MGVAFVIVLSGCGRLGYPVLFESTDGGSPLDGGRLSSDGALGSDGAPGDGSLEPGRPVTLAAAAIGGAGDQYAFDLAFDSASNLAVAGVADGPTDLGLATVNPTGVDDGYVVSYDRNLDPRWAFVLGSDDRGEAWELDQAANGRVYVTGVYQGSGSAAVPPSTSRQAAIWIELDQDTGASLDGDTYATTGNVQGRGLDAAGAVFAMGGLYQGNVDLGLGPLGGTGGWDAGFVAVWNASSSDAPVYARPLLTSENSGVNDVALLPDGSLCVGGRYEGTPSFGAGVTLPAARGANDGYVARLDPAGVVEWARVIDGTDGDQVYGVAGAVDGDCVVTGYLSAGIDLGNGPLPFGGTTDPFVARFEASSGATVWAATFNAPGRSTGAEVLVADGLVYVTGPYTGELSVGESIAPDRGASDVFLVALDASTGAPAWVESGGGASDDGDPLNMGLAVSPDGTRLAVSGSVAAAATFGEITVGGNGVDAFLWVLQLP